MTKQTDTQRTDAPIEQPGISNEGVNQATSIESLLSDARISASRLVEAASIIGHTLQGIPKAQRQLTVARMRNLADKLIKASANPGDEHLGLYAMALTVTANAWEDFS